MFVKSHINFYFKKSQRFLKTVRTAKALLDCCGFLLRHSTEHEVANT